jgi:hypothetical protein
VTYATYRVGNPARPPISHDNGFLDKFKRRMPTQDERRKYTLWKIKLEAGEAVQGMPFAPHLTDALAAYRHFLGASGSTRTINYERYTANDASGQTTLQYAIVEAMNAGYDLYAKSLGAKAGCLNFTGGTISCGGTNGFFPYPKTENWQKAIGAHTIWLSGTINGAPERSGPQMEYDLTFTLHMEDMYNFNPGAKDIATGIPDSENGIFEVTGLAKQYLNVATLTRRATWKGAPAKAYNVSMAPILRQRQPSDNRRARNRV